MAYEYKWTLNEIDELYLYEFIQLYKKILDRKEYESKWEITKMQLLTSVIHTGEPDKLIEQMNSIINNEDIDDEIGDLNKLRLMKEKQAYREVGE